VHENPTLPINFLNPEEWKEAFRNATHLERLALVRNPALNETLIEQIFDHEDQELGISLEARGELVKAFLTNHQAIRDSYRDQSDFIPGFLGGHPAAFTRAHFSKLWILISKWPEGTRNLQASVYRYLGLPTKRRPKFIRAAMNRYGEQRFSEILINVTRRPLNSVCRISMNNAENLPTAGLISHRFMSWTEFFRGKIPQRFVGFHRIVPFLLMYFGK
jgi:hypothetical protein